MSQLKANIAPARIGATNNIEVELAAKAAAKEQVELNAKGEPRGPWPNPATQFKPGLIGGQKHHQILIKEQREYMEARRNSDEPTSFLGKQPRLCTGRMVATLIDDMQDLPVADLKCIAMRSDHGANVQIAAKRLVAARGGMEDQLSEKDERSAAMFVMDYTDGKPLVRSVAIVANIRSPESELAELERLCGFDRVTIGTRDKTPCEEGNTNE